MRSTSLFTNRTALEDWQVCLPRVNTQPPLEFPTVMETLNPASFLVPLQMSLKHGL